MAYSTDGIVAIKWISTSPLIQLGQLAIYYIRPFGIINIKETVI